VISRDLEEEVSKEQYKKEVAVHGSGQLARSLFDLSPPDELRLMTFPVVIGEESASSTASTCMPSSWLT
jgi:dihydrofolate reductase